VPVFLTACVPVFLTARLPVCVTVLHAGSIAHFLNECVLEVPRFRSVKPPGPPVEYLIGGPFRCADAAAKMLLDGIERGDFAPEDVFILAPTVKAGRAESPTPVNKLLNVLVVAGVPCHAAHSDAEKLRDAVIKGKCVASSLHSVRVKRAQGVGRPFESQRGPGAGAGAAGATIIPRSPYASQCR